MYAEIEKLKEFHHAFGATINRLPTIPDNATKELRKRLINEEAEEFCLAVDNDDIVEIFDAIIDLLYVTLGAAVSFGFGCFLTKSFKQVHENNMSKLGPNGKPITDDGGKVLKPEGYKPVDLAWIKKYMNLENTSNDNIV